MKFVLLIAIFATISQLVAGNIRRSFKAVERPEHVDELKQISHKSRSSRITNGLEQSVGQFPFSILMYTYFSFGWGYCSGSLISNQFVLGTVDCFLGSELETYVYFGNYLLNPDLTIPVSRYFPHSEDTRDIALFELSEIVGFSEKIQPAQLPPLSATGSTYDNKKATMVGWGTTAPNTEVVFYPRYAEMKVLSNFDCLLTFYDPWVDCSLMVAVGITDQNAGVCSGDNGGGLVIQENNTFTIIGMINYPVGDCEDGMALFTRISPYLSFINDVTGIPLRQK